MVRRQLWRSWRFWGLVGGGLVLGCIFLLIQIMVRRSATIKIEGGRWPDQMVVDNDDNLLAVSDSTGITLFSLPNYRQIVDFDVQIYKDRLAWNSNMSQFATIDSKWTTVHVWDVQSKTNIQTLPSTADGRITRSSGSYSIGPEYIAGLAWHPDGKTIAIARFGGRRELWNLETNTVTVMPQVGDGGSRDCFRWTVDGEVLLMDYDYGVQAYEWPSLEPQENSHWVACDTLIARQDNFLLATGSVMDVTVLMRHGLPVESKLHGGGHIIAWHPTQPVLAIVNNRTITLWSFWQNKIVEIPAKDQTFFKSVAFTPDEQGLIVGIDDPDHPGAIHEWPLHELAPELFNQDHP